MKKSKFLKSILVTLSTLIIFSCSDLMNDLNNCLNDSVNSDPSKQAYDSTKDPFLLELTEKISDMEQFEVLTIKLTNENKNALPYLKDVLPKKNTQKFVLDLYDLDIEEIPEDCFAYSKKVKQVILPKNLKKIGSFAFDSMYELESVIFPNTLEEIEEYAFFCCKKLNNVVFPFSLKKIGYCAFDSCTNFTSIILNEGLEELQEAVFSCCDNVEYLYIPSTLISLGEEDCALEQVFSGCDSLKQIIIDSKNKTYKVFKDGCIYKMDKDGNKETLMYYPSTLQLTEFTVPKNVNICSGAFARSKTLTSIIIEEGEKDIYIGNAAFSDSYITSVTIPSNVTKMSFGYSFVSKNIDIENITIADTTSSWKKTIIQHDEEYNPIIDEENFVIEEPFTNNTAVNAIRLNEVKCIWEKN